MEWIETTGRSVEEAKDMALDRLGIDSSEAEFEVVEEPKRGLLGRIKGEARVRARVRPTQPRPKVDQRSRRGGGQRSGAQKKQGGGGSQKGQQKKQDGGGSQRGQQKKQDDRRGGQQQKKQGGDQQRGGGRGNDRVGTAAASAGAGGRKDKAPTMNLEQQAEEASKFITGLAEEFGATDVSTEIVKIDDGLAEVRLTGTDVGLMIGPKGGTLQAIQELTKTVLQRACGGAGEGRIRIDIGGFRERRREALEKFVLSLVDDVVDSGRSKALEPMNSADRKVVHDTLVAVDGVTTSSEGDDPQRRVVIHPA